MGQSAVLHIPRELPRLVLLPDQAERVAARNTPNVFLLGLVLSILQLLDGALTAIGVGRYGISEEGNPLIRSLMLTFGHIPAILFVKLAAIYVVLILCKLASQVTWVPLALKFVIAVYIVVAVAPWSYFLISDYFS